MKSYTFHAPAEAAPGDPGALETAQIVPDRFVWMAFGFTFLWFFFHRLWLAGTAILLLLVGLHAALNFFNVHPAASFGAQFLVALLVGLEASSLWRWTLTRRGLPARAVVVATNRDEAEAKAFGRWLDGGNLPSTPPPPAPFRNAATFAASRNEPVLGLFPEPERGR